jgi:hypothetical protein
MPSIKTLVLDSQQWAHPSNHLHAAETILAGLRPPSDMREGTKECCGIPMLAKGSSEVGSSSSLVRNTVPCPPRTPRVVQQVSVSGRLTQFHTKSVTTISMTREWVIYKVLQGEAIDFLDCLRAKFRHSVYNYPLGPLSHTHSLVYKKNAGC